MGSFSSSVIWNCWQPHRQSALHILRSFFKNEYHCLCLYQGNELAKNIIYLRFIFVENNASGM